MTKSPFLWLAGAAGVLGGAVAGNALGSFPVLDKEAVGAFYQSHEDSAFSGEAPSAALPDHYPLVTRNGTVPVAELANRGLYSQARYRDLYQPADYDAKALAEADYYQNVAEPRDEGDDESLRVGDPAPQRAAVNANPAAIDSASPLTLAEGPATIGSQGRARLIDVKATLAMR